MARSKWDGIWIAWVLACLSGCQPAGQPEGESHEHFPPHWPATIFQASKRLTEFVEQEDPTSAVHRIPPRQELVDLVGWLPILAADSDLDRSTFDRIDSASNRIAVRWQSVSATRETTAMVNEPEVREMIDWLAQVCQQEQTRIDQLEL